MRGIFLDGQRAKVAQLHSVSPRRLRVVLQQGINRQIRRMFEAVGYRVPICRVGIGVHSQNASCDLWRGELRRPRTWRRRSSALHCETRRL